MNGSSADLAVAVVTYNSKALIHDLIRSLDLGLAGLAYRLVIADNASTDGTVEYLREIAPGAEIVEVGHNGGYAAGINAAARAAGTFSALLVLNPDVRLSIGCVQELMRGLATANTGIAVPRLLDAHGELIESMRREPTVLRAFGEAFLGIRRAGRLPAIGEIVSVESAYETESVVDWAEGSTQLISAECWTRCGPWDESFFLYSEEADFNLRARDAGFVTRYMPDAVATHLEGGTSPALWSLLVVNRVRLFRRRHGRMRTSWFWLATMLREASRAAFGRARSRAAARALLSPSRMRQKPGPDWIASFG